MNIDRLTWLHFSQEFHYQPLNTSTPQGFMQSWLSSRAIKCHVTNWSILATIQVRTPSKQHITHDHPSSALLISLEPINTTVLLKSSFIQDVMCSSMIYLQVSLSTQQYFCISLLNYSLCTRIGYISNTGSNLNTGPSKVPFTQISSLTKKLTMSVVSVHLPFFPQYRVTDNNISGKACVWCVHSKHKL